MTQLGWKQMLFVSDMTYNVWFENCCFLQKLRIYGHIGNGWDWISDSENVSQFLTSRVTRVTKEIIMLWRTIDFPAFDGAISTHWWSKHWKSKWLQICFEVLFCILSTFTSARWRQSCFYLLVSLSLLAWHWLIMIWDTPMKLSCGIMNLLGYFLLFFHLYRC